MNLQSNPNKEALFVIWLGCDKMAKQHWVDLDLKGEEKAINGLRNVQANIQVSMKRIMLRCALILEAEIKRQITNMGLVVTGNLRVSVHSFVREKFQTVEGVAGTNVNYAPFLEYGTGARGDASGHPDVPADYQYGDHLGIKAYKFMYRAWMNKRDEIIAYMNAEIRKIIKWSKGGV